MEKIYKVQMYDCHYPNHAFPGQMHQLYTSLELIDFVNNTLREKADTISDACASSTVATVTSTKSLSNSQMMTSLATSNLTAQ
jgi:hypothetical protein